MNFEKKYWSENEYTDKDGNDFKGYVGIFNKEAYNFINEEQLFGKNSYLARINTSKHNFDRILSHELKLPFKRKDVTFAANDFLYSGIIKTAIERLQANNDYLFKNSIISNSILPATEECILFSSLTDSDGKFDKDKHSGILGKYNFSTAALNTKTQDDPAFYSQTEKDWKYYVKNKMGQNAENISSDTAFIINKDKEIKQYDGEIDENGKLNAAETWHKLYGPSNDDYEITEEEINNDYKVNRNEILDYTEYVSNSINGAFEDKNISASTKNIKVSIKSDIIYNLLSSNIRKEDVHLRIHSLDFIVKGNPSNLISINDISVNKAPNSIVINNGYNHVTYNFNAENNITDSNELNGIELNDFEFDEKNKTLSLSITFASDCTICGYKDNSDENIIDLKCAIKFSVGNSSMDFDTYKTIPNVTRDTQFSYVWERTVKKDDKDETIEHISLPTHTYKFLTESEEWLKAKNNNENPRLKMNNWGSNDVRNYIPEPTMVAADVYNFMCNNPTSYDYPTVVRNVKYTFDGYTSNPQYKEIVYSTSSYSFDEENKIVSGYKPTKYVYDDLYNIDDEENESLKNSAKKYDKIPNVFRQEYIKSVKEDELIHNFNEITAADIVIRDLDESSSTCTLLIFLLFKNKLVIFKTKYYFNNISDRTDTKQNFILTEKDYNEDREIDLRIDLKKEIIVIDRIDPHDDSSLKYMNLNAIKIHKNMMYLIDNKLDMVLRYNIDYLVNSNEIIENAFKKSSIKLIDIMQGLGTTTDKIYFNNPYSIAVDDNHVYIVDRGNKCVKEYTSSLNFVKTLKNGFFSSHDIQAVAINPYPCVINGVDIKKDSIWIASVLGTRMFISVLEDDIVKAYGQIEDITLLQDNYTWLEEIRGINFSKNHSNYFYINTTKRVYKFHVSQPFYPFASLSYFKQRSIVGTMRWSAMRYPWDKIPTIYGRISSDENNIQNNEITWDYQPPQTAAEVLDNKCFCLSGDSRIEGDIIFHFGILYNDSEIRNYIKTNKSKYNDKMTFYDIDSGTLATMIKSSAMLLYKESDSFISTLSNNSIKIYDTYKIENNTENDYINSLNVNKILYALVYNLLKIKNSLIGHFRAATNIDNVIVYDNVVLDDYFNNLKLNSEEDYFVHDNEAISIIANRALEDIHDLQEKILQKMQTEFMAAQSYVNNTSRLI